MTLVIAQTKETDSPSTTTLPTPAGGAQMYYPYGYHHGYGGYRGYGYGPYNGYRGPYGPGYGYDRYGYGYDRDYGYGNGIPSPGFIVGTIVNRILGG